MPDDTPTTHTRIPLAAIEHAHALACSSAFPLVLGLIYKFIVGAHAGMVQFPPGTPPPHRPAYTIQQNGHRERAR